MADAVVPAEHRSLAGPFIHRVEKAEQLAVPPSAPANRFGARKPRRRLRFSPARRPFLLPRTQNRNVL
jgi:hypothetical protein